MSKTQWPSKVVPAQLSFLAIYNPSLGPTEETFEQQVVFYFSRTAHEARIAAKKDSRDDKAGGDAARQEENEKLRQIGLAQGMVDFAKSFSNGEPVDSIETEKSRIVLHELEPGWWILASIALTRLPAIPLSPTEATRADGTHETKPAVEYSSREVSPPALLLQQLLQAHHIFSLHHGPSLSYLYERQPRDKFCNTLDRFWTRFSRNWDVLLHGNPAADVFSGLKVASGGELGFGVGEEEWGSGEREVLEDLTHRTEGLVDIIVSRFGEPLPADETKATPESEALPWMGNGSQPIATDGVIFGGVGAIERHSLRDLSLWMRQIYSSGEYAYGVRDNPLRERRKRRRRNPPAQAQPANGSIDQIRRASRDVDAADLRQRLQKKQVAEQQESTNATAGLNLPKDPRPEIHPRVVSHDHTTTPEETPSPPVDGSRPNIPRPIVSAAEDALDKATHQAERNAEQADQDAETAEDAGTTLGIPDQYMKYLTFGLSTLAKPAPKKRPPAERNLSTASTIKPTSQHAGNKSNAAKQVEPVEADDDVPTMSQLEPMPEGDALKARIAVQKRQENRGHFVVGFRGDLDNLDDMSDDAEEELDDSSHIVLRTLHVEVKSDSEDSNSEDEGRLLGRRRPSAFRLDSASYTGMNVRRLRVLVYAHRPFVYCFLFDNSTPSLQYARFYKNLHRSLLPIHKPLLSSTSVTKLAQLIENAHGNTADSASISSGNTTNRLPSKGSNSSPIFDLIYDPRLLTLHTSIPNIPEPGTPAAEGILSSFRSDAAVTPAWTRVEALNVHSQVLNTLASVRNRKNEVERTSKTSRGWWVVWMKLPPSAPAVRVEQASGAQTYASDETVTSGETITATTAGDNVTITQVPDAGGPDMHRVAFLVRKASDSPAAASKTSSTSSRAMSSLFGNMSLGLGSREEDTTGGPSAGWGPSALAGGIGIDARRYVEGLLSLNR